MNLNLTLKLIIFGSILSFILSCLIISFIHYSYNIDTPVLGVTSVKIIDTKCTSNGYSEICIGDTVKIAGEENNYIVSDVNNNYVFLNKIILRNVTIIDKEPINKSVLRFNLIKE